MNNGAVLPFPRGGTASSFDTQIVSNVMNGPLQSTLPIATGTVSGATPFRPDLATWIGEDRDVNLTNTPAATIAAMTTTFNTSTGVAGLIYTPGTNQKIKLRAVQLSADLCIGCVGQLITYSSTATEWGVVTGTGTTAGVVAAPIDNAIPLGTVLKKYDWVWVHEGGPCYVTVVNSGSNIVVGNAIAYGGVQTIATVASATSSSLGSTAGSALNVSCGVAKLAVPGTAVIGTAGSAITSPSSSTLGSTCILLLYMKPDAQMVEP
jgi:hypothetical protein